MKAIKDNIKSILEDIPELSNDRQEFVWHYYRAYHNEIMFEPTGIFLQYLWLKKPPSTATLERLWRMVQMENPELRGSEWNKRQRQVKPVKKDLGYNMEYDIVKMLSTSTNPDTIFYYEDNPDKTRR